MPSSGDGCQGESNQYQGHYYRETWIRGTKRGYRRTSGSTLGIECMKTRICILFIVLFVSAVASKLLNCNAVASEPLNNEEITSTCDTIVLGDSIIVIHTVCAPICSSCARVYNKEWQFLGNMTPPIQTAFPEAYIEDGKLLWRDNDTYDYTPTP